MPKHESHFWAPVCESDAYLHANIEDMYPEIGKSIQLRRAEYYMLVHQKHMIMNMLKHGQIEDKEAAEMKNEVDDKIFSLQLTQPEIKLMSH